MLDYLIKPLLACMRFKTLTRLARELLQRVCAAIEATPFAHEVPIYREAIDRAASGYNFFEHDNLPTDLLIRMMNSKPKGLWKTSLNVNDITLTNQIIIRSTL